MDLVLSTKNDGTYTFDFPKDIFDSVKPYVRGNMWRLKISDTNNPNTYSYSERFILNEHSNDTSETRKLEKELGPEDFHKYSNIMRDLDREEIDQSREKERLAGMKYFLNSLRQNNHVPASLKYSQITVCRECYLVYNRLELRKRDVGRLKDAGCIVDDCGQVIEGPSPVKALTIRPLDEAQLEQQMKAIVDGVQAIKSLPAHKSAAERHRVMVRKRERREEHQNALNQICMDIESSVARGLGISEESIHSLNSAYLKARSVGVPLDAPSMRNADFVKQKAKKLNKKQQSEGRLPENGMFNKYVSGPSKAWEASAKQPPNMFVGDISSSDDDDEPLIANMKSLESFLPKAPKLPPSVTVGPRRKGWTLVKGVGQENSSNSDSETDEEPLLSTTVGGGDLRNTDIDDKQIEPKSSALKLSHSVPLISSSKYAKNPNDYQSPTRASLPRQRQKPLSVSKETHKRTKKNRSEKLC